MDNQSSLLLDDPKLPHLMNLLDVDEMTGHFDQHLHAAGLEPQWEVTRCAIERVYYRPTRHCGVLYRLTFRDPSGCEADEWFFGRMLPQGEERRQLKKVASVVKQVGTSRDFLWTILPVSFWQSFNMILWIFPQDPGLATLPEVVDPVLVRNRVEANLERLGAVIPSLRDASELKAWRCTDVYYDRIKYMPGKRCVLRYNVTLAGPEDQSQEVTFYSKTYNDAMSRYHFEFLQSAREQLLAQEAMINIPGPLLHFADINTSWHEEWKGASLIEGLDQHGNEEIFPRIATMLASLHRSQIDGLRIGPDLDDVFMTAKEDVVNLTRSLTQYRSQTTISLDYLAATKSVLENKKIPTVPIHGACRLEQMLVRDTELALVDFDALAVGDPLFDIAEFIASLHYLEFSHGRCRAELTKAATLFLESYANQVQWPCDRRRIAWYVLAFLISKVFASVKHLDIPALQRFESCGGENFHRWFESN